MIATRRKRLDDTISARTFVLGGGGLAVLAAMLWVAFTAPQGIPGRNYYVLHAQFHDLANLPPRGADVRIAGDRVGQALGARIEHGHPTINLQLERSGRLRSDTTARVRPRGLLGMQYIELVPGVHGRLLPNGSVLPMAQTSASVQLPQVLSAFDGPRRRGLQQVLRGLGDGMAGRGAQLNEELRNGRATLGGLRATWDAVLARPGAVERFVHGAEALATASDPVRDDIASGFDPEARAMRPFSAERRSVQRTLDVAPGTFEQMRTGLAQTDRMLDSLGRFAAASERFTAAAPAALAATHRLLVSSPRPLSATRPVLADLQRTVPAALRFTAAASPVLPHMRSTLEAAIPPSAELGRRPCDMLGFWSNWSDMLANGVPGGGPIGPLNTVRFELIGGTESVAGAGAHRPETGRNPYPAPCAAGTERLP